MTDNDDYSVIQKDYDEGLFRRYVEELSIESCNQKVYREGRRNIDQNKRINEEGYRSNQSQFKIKAKNCNKNQQRNRTLIKQVTFGQHRIKIPKNQSEKILKRVKLPDNSIQSIEKPQREKGKVKIKLLANDLSKYFRFDIAENRTKLFIQTKGRVKQKIQRYPKGLNFSKNQINVSIISNQTNLQTMRNQTNLQTIRNQKRLKKNKALMNINYLEKKKKKNSFIEFLAERKKFLTPNQPQLRSQRIDAILNHFLKTTRSKIFLTPHRIKTVRDML